MRLAELTVGFVVLVFSILGYQYSSSLVEAFQHMTGDFVTSFFPNINLHNQQGYLLQMGYPSADSITKITQVGFIATAIIGAGFACYALIAKKPIAKQLSNKLSNIIVETKFVPPPLETKLTPSILESTKHENLTNNRALSILKERLVRGEITEKEFEKLRRFLE
ncbi:MAG: hypothetical protein E6K98_04425 [Thaumarchaeota archaeon]|nr:MAG: hypothetical protein E6K98_04425 [Nitrososphaerota archaeon]